MKLMELNRYKTISLHRKASLTWIFLTQFLNAGMLLLLVNATFEDIWGLLDFFRVGKYPDFTQNWYNDVGCLNITIMIWLIVFPILEFLILVICFR